MSGMSKYLWLLMTVMSMGTALVTWKYMFFMDFSGWQHHLAERPLATYLHFTFGPLALFLGGFQFLGRVRTARPSLHRGLGWVYVLACLSAAAGAMPLAIHSEAGPVAGLGFSVLSVIWVYVTLQAVVSARARDFSRHRVWMIRSFALTFSAATLRLYLGVFVALLGWDYSEVYITVSWACWLINLLIVEIWIIPQPTGTPSVRLRQAS